MIHPRIAVVVAALVALLPSAPALAGSKIKSFKRGYDELSLLRSYAIAAATRRPEVPDYGCWRNTYGRGVGTPRTECPAGLVAGGTVLSQFCYPAARPSYSCVETGCWGNCPPGFADTGGHCMKPAATWIGGSAYAGTIERGSCYARGLFGECWGYHLKSVSEMENCERARGQGNCQKRGLLAYPKCPAGTHERALFCSPDCPPGTGTDIGVSCEKLHYDRGVGSPFTCKAGLELGAPPLGLCYPPCKAGYSAETAAICTQNCPAGSVACGPGMCAPNQAACAQNIADMVIAPLELVVDIVLAAATGGSANAAKQTAKTAVKSAVKAGAKQAAKTAARKAVYQAVKTGAKNALTKVTTAVGEKLTKKFGQELAKDIAKHVAEQMAVKVLTADVPEVTTDGIAIFREIADWDPTGVLAVGAAFAKPMCDEDPVLPDVDPETIRKALEMWDEDLEALNAGPDPAPAAPAESPIPAPALAALKADVATCGAGVTMLSANPYVHPSPLDRAAPGKQSWRQVYVDGFNRQNLAACTRIGEFLTRHAGHTRLRSIEVMVNKSPGGWGRFLDGSVGITFIGSRIVAHCPSGHGRSYDCVQARVRLTANLTELDGVLSELARL